ncbi:hypothetical protein K443DRAFT_6793 [Laccaria amethystina LaAM-08-1]|uniref:Uncharacterized protein n=1 Tax=Laccaria amethystina LaAM-08-1 TaxID=1095629 RepID=A0A0C9Y0N0_9AGAR|nr:hypothetical protein K443DRAFT_6793 [Laccaria amethystina LaAM-08-1]
MRLFLTFYGRIAALRKSLVLITVFGFLTLTFVALAAGTFTGLVNVTKAGGVLGVLTALIAYYTG